MKKIAIIGGGASGTLLAILLKRKSNNFDVTIFDKKEFLLKKIKASGNGRCNFANKNYLNGNYSNTDFVNPILKDFDHIQIINFFNELGIKETNIDDLYYPHSLSSLTVFSKLKDELDKLGVEFIDEKINTYIKNNSSYLLNNKYEFDIVVFATGGKSSPKLGSNGSLFEEFKKHGYQINDLYPGLTPIKIKENVKELDGVRMKSNVKLIADNKIYYEEDGEILFKKDGLSGIAIMNASSIVSRYKLDNASIHLDFIKDDELLICSTPKELYEAYVHPKLINYLLKIESKDVNKAIKLIKDLKFTYKDNYGFEFSQVTVGGIRVNNLTNYLESKIENNIYFVGEVIDVDAICGGYNLMWAFASSYRVYKYLTKGE